MSNEEILTIMESVNCTSGNLNSLINDIIEPYCKELDDYVDFIKDILHGGNVPATMQELEDICINLPVFLYYASGMQEQLGIKDDIAKAVYSEVYNNKRNSQEKGTVSDKDSVAELESQYEKLVSICYKRAYTIVKSKVSSAQELLSSVKKVITRRMSEYELTRIGGN